MAWLAQHRACARLVTVLVISCLPTAALAEDCAALASEISDTDRQAEALLADNQGSAAVHGGCLLVGLNEYNKTHDGADATASYGVCAALACALTESYSNCWSVGGKLFALALQKAIFQERARSWGCRLD